MNRILTLLLLLTIGAAVAKTDKVPWCVDPGEDRGLVKPEYNITNAALIVHWGKMKNDYGRAEYEAHPKENMVFCELWLEAKPKKV